MKPVSSCFGSNVFTNRLDHCRELYLNNLSEFFEVNQVEDKSNQVSTATILFPVDPDHRLQYCSTKKPHP